MLGLTECFYRRNFGVICPYCGGTRFIFYFLKLDFVKSFRYHPTSFVFLIFVIISTTVFIVDKIRKKPNRITIKYVVISLSVYLVATIIQYIIRLYLMANNIHNPFIEINI